MSSYPQEVKNAFYAEECNGFGFQSVGAGPPGTIIFVQIYHSDLIDLIDERTLSSTISRIVPNTTTLQGFDFLGRSFVGIHYSEWESIPSVIQWLLDNHYSLSLHNKLKSYFREGEIFSWKTAEQKTIQLFMDFINSNKEIMSWKAAFSLLGHHSWTKHWNWTTQEGKDFCTLLRRMLDKKPLSKKTPRYLWDSHQETCKKYKILHFSEGWSKYIPSMTRVDEPLVNIIEDRHCLPWDGKDNAVMEDMEKEDDMKEDMEVYSSNNVVVENNDVKDGMEVSNNVVVEDMEEEDNECIICFSNKANTIVLPCQHVVVCSECSQGLKNTPDKKQCVRCRQNITLVLEDSKPDYVLE